MVAAAIVAGLGAVTSAFDAAPASTLATDLESLFASVWEIAPLILIILVAFAAVSWVGKR